MAVFSPFLLESALRLISRFDLMSRIKMGNTMISNVPGAPVPLYVAGAVLMILSFVIPASCMSTINKLRIALEETDPAPSSSIR